MRPAVLSLSRTLVTASLVVALSGGFAACGGDDGDDVTTDTADVAAADSVTPDAAGDHGQGRDVPGETVADAAVPDAAVDGVEPDAPDVGHGDTLPGDTAGHDASDGSAPDADDVHAPDAGDVIDDDTAAADAALDPGVPDTFELPTDQPTCLAAGFCWIDAGCRLPGDRDPTRPCWACDPTTSAGAWTMLGNTAACDDGNLETYGDACNAGECAGTFVICPVMVGQCAAEAHPDGTPNCNYEYPVGRACNDNDLCTCNDACDGGGNCSGSLVVCPIVISPCYPGGHCDGGCACAMDPWPGHETSCPIQDGTGWCNGTGSCQAVSCNPGFVRSSVIPDACVPAFVSLSAGESHTCGVTSDHRAYCWGDNASGQLGDGTNTDRTVPTPVKNLTDVAGITAGQDFTCAWTTTGAAWCWGAAAVGQLGHGSSWASNEPVAVNLLADGVTRVSAGALHACAVRNGEVWCWGSNGTGQLGINSPPASYSIPQKVSLATSVDVFCGGQHTCATTFQHNVVCWGDNQSGQLGIDSTTTLWGPQYLVNENGTTRSGDLGSQHSCVLEEVPISLNGLMYYLECWGSDSQGQTTGPGGESCVTGPCDLTQKTAGYWESNVLLPPPPPPALGSFHTCYVDSLGGLYCTGHNDFGQLGVGDTAGRQMFLPVFASDSTDVVAGGRHTCGIVVGALFCWGKNTDGQLGDGTLDDRHNPVQVRW